MTDAVQGIVEEVLPSNLFRVSTGERSILAHLAGKMRLHKIRVLVGDKVSVMLDPHGGKTTNRIIRRL